MQLSGRVPADHLSAPEFEELLDTVWGERDGRALELCFGVWEGALLASSSWLTANGIPLQASFEPSLQPTAYSVIESRLRRYLVWRGRRTDLARFFDGRIHEEVIHGPDLLWGKALEAMIATDTDLEATFVGCSSAVARQIINAWPEAILAGAAEQLSSYC
jgi:hypothetical protein